MAKNTIIDFSFVNEYPATVIKSGNAGIKNLRVRYTANNEGSANVNPSLKLIKPFRKF